MSQIIVVTGASSGFGAMTVRALADAGHTVYAGIRNTSGRNAPAVADTAGYAAEHAVDLRTVELDVSNQDSVDAAIARIIDEQGRLDVVVHNAGHMVLGPTEAFTPEQIAAEVARFGIDTTIIVPGAFTTGTNHFAHAGHAADTDVADAYEARYAGLMDQVGARLAELSPPDADPTEVAAAIVRVVDTPKGQRPFRIHIDPADDGAEQVNALGDRVRREFYARIGLADLLSPATSA